MPDLCPKFFLFPVRNGMTDRSRHIALKSFDIVRQTVKQFSITDHSFTSEHLTLDKFFDQTVVLSCCFHSLIIIEESLLPGIAAKDSSASHKVYCFQDHRKFQLVKCCLQFFSVVDTDMFCTADAAFYKSFFHIIFVAAKRS